MKRNSNGQFIKGENIIDKTGQRFGKLVVLEIDHERTNRKTYWKCQCDCGNIKSVRSDSLGIINSCGCIKKEQDIINLGIINNHNLAGHILYQTWNAMMQRCYNPNQVAYKNYGGRGIAVCDDWHDISKFIEWAEINGYKEGLTIERINVNGGYNPDNCKWITKSEQAYNKRNSVKITINGETKCLMQWVHELNIPLGRVWEAPSKGIPYEQIISKYSKRWCLSHD